MQATIEELMMVKHQLDELTEREKELKKQVLTAMQNVNEDSWCNDLIQFTRKAAYERESIDSKELKAKMPEVYESFKKTTKVAESISYKLL
jgi:predicted phage-related endonuclease